MANIVLLDGGMGQELLARSNNRNPQLWSAEFLMEQPDLVRQVHLDYILAGARVVTINTYAASYTRMATVNAVDKVPHLQRIACDLAQQARDQAGAQGAGVAVAGSLPPLNGSYRPDRVMDYDVILDEYRRIVALQAPHVDVFICETMSTAAEAKAAALAGAESGKPVWVGFTLEEDGGHRLRSAETIAAAMAELKGINVAAVLANCSQPESVSAAMPELVATGLPAGGYANGFKRIPGTFLPGKTQAMLSAREDLDPAAYAEFAMQWVADGAAIVGGCCEVGPAHIAKLRDELLAAGHTLVASP